jgi:DNA-binding response OmpR family regulator
MKALPKILIAEDDELHIRILSKYFQKGDYEVRFARNGYEGLESARTFHPDLVISDWMMPEMSGEEFCKTLKGTPELEQIYFIMLTAKNQIEDLVRGLDFGADDFLSKPYDPKELMARVRTGLRIVALQRENLRLKQIQTVQQTAITANHEINNPLQTIISNAELILNQNTNWDEQTKQRIQTIIENAGKIRRVTKRMENLAELVSKEYVAGGPEMVDLERSLYNTDREESQQ